MPLANIGVFIYVRYQPVFNLCSGGVCIFRGQDTLRSLVDYLAAFAREFLDTAGIPLRTDIPRNVPDLPLDATALRLAHPTSRILRGRSLPCSLCRLAAPWR